MEKEFNKIDRETLKNISKELDLEHSKKKEFNLSEKRKEIIKTLFNIDYIGFKEYHNKRMNQGNNNFSFSSLDIYNILGEVKKQDKEFIKNILTPNNISKGFVEVSTIKYYAGKELVEEKE